MQHGHSHKNEQEQFHFVSGKNNKKKNTILNWHPSCLLHESYVGTGKKVNFFFDILFFFLSGNSGVIFEGNLVGWRTLTYSRQGFTAEWAYYSGSSDEGFHNDPAA